MNLKETGKSLEVEVKEPWEIARKNSWDQEMVCLVKETTRKTVSLDL